MSRVRVLIADDHMMVRIGISTMLEAFDEFELVGEAANGEEAIARCAELHPDVVLMDVVMPRMDGITAAQHILADAPGICIIILSSFDEPRMIRSAIDAGAFGYLLKSISAQELVASIRTAMRGLPALSPQAARVLVHDTRTVKPAFMLTERETEVLRLIVQGLSNNEIAARLHLSPFTVKNHVSSLLTKLDASSRTEAAMRAVQSGLITPDG